MAHAGYDRRIETIPYPPLSLANRVGCLDPADDPWAYYDDLGRRARSDIEDVLPQDWSWEGKRVLDFGCGAGRTLRRFVDVPGVEFYGCDIDAESIDWMNANLSPPITAFVNGEHPPLPQPDGHFDLIYVVSVFTHLTSSWSEWLLELRRVLADDGLLVVTFMGEGCMGWILGDEPWIEDETGMLVVGEHASWDDGGPMVLHSSWWIREHWGRAFDVVEFVPFGFGLDLEQAPGQGQGIVVLAKNGERDLSVADLERLRPDEPREAPALARNLMLVQREVGNLRFLVADAARQRDAALEHQQAHKIVMQSRSWRWTAPLRETAKRARGQKSPPAG